jgi:hypothetical protein
MAKVKVRVPSFAFALALMAGACSALTGVNKFDVNDCPKGDCSEGGPTSSSGGDATTDGAFADGTSSGGGGDSAIDSALGCAAGTSLVTLTVTGQTSTTVTINGSGAVLVPPNPGSMCLPIGQERLRATNKGSWTCTSGCVESQSDTDQFTFNNPATGSTITANLQN